MSKYQGDEQSNPILKFIHNSFYFGNSRKTLELSNLQNAYQLWNAAKLGVVSFLSSREAQDWFGHSLFTANVKVYMSYNLLKNISNLFSPDPRRPAMPAPQFAAYQPPYIPYSDPELQIERYSSFSTFLWHLLGALDVMTVGLAFLYDFEQLRTTCCPPSFKPSPIKPLKINFHIGVSLLRQVDIVIPIGPVNLLNVFKIEGLLDWDPATSRTKCDWYEDLRVQRHYYTHIGFPMLYMDNEGWHVPIDARSAAPASSLTDRVPNFCRNLFDNVYRFIGEVYGSAWADFSPFLESVLT